MKKVVTLLTALLLGTLVSIPVYADTDADVWCETNAGQGDDLSVSVETNGKTTDGVVIIGYDSSVVSCTEADVKISDSVDMYSVNVVDESVRISFLAEDAIEAGAIAEVSFEAVDKNADKDTLKSAISFAGEVYNENGEALIVKTGGEEEPKGPGSTGGENGQQTGTSAGVSAGNVSTSKAAQVANTGDNAEITYLVLLLTAGVLFMAFSAAFAKKKAAAFAKKNTGRKLNH